MSSYVRILLKEFYTALKQEIMECYAYTDVDESVLDQVLADNTEVSHEEQY